MPEFFDLFGDPVPANHGRRGRPQHIPTMENRRKVNMLLALGWNNDRIAKALRITSPSLRKHYFPELKCREVARDRLTAAVAMKLWDQVESGNVGAIKEFGRFLEKNDLMTFGQMVKPQAQPKEPKLGKKEAAVVAAQMPDTGTPLGELMARRQGSSLN